MRYTTLIDITEIPAIYRNVHARLLYMHMALRAGYHDADRDVLNVSIRRLADEAGLSVSATRHALATLQKGGLIAKQGTAWKVLKWIAAPPPTPRTQAAARKATDKSLGAQIDSAQSEAESYQRRVIAAVRSCTKEQLQQWLSELEKGSTKPHCGVRLNPTIANKEWLAEIIAQM